MNLRLRLIVAFFFLSVVPLAAVTLYTYTSNATALRDAAQHEAELLAGELSQRMQVVTAQLSERVERLMEISSVQAGSSAPATTSASGTSKAALPQNSATDADKVAETLGDVSMLLNNIQLTGMRPFGGGGGRRGGGQGGSPPDNSNGNGQGGFGPRGNGSSGAGAGAGADANSGSSFGRGRFGSRGGENAPPSPGSSAARGPAPMGQTGSAAPDGGATTRQFPQDRGPRGFGPPHDRGDQTAGGAPTSAPPGSPSAPSPAGVTNTFGPPPNPPATPRASAPGTAAADATDKDRIQIDLMPIRRELFQQFASEGQWSQMSDADHQRIIAEVNQRMLGIAQGIQISTAELQKRVTEARQVADSKARDIARTQMGVSDARGKAASAGSASTSTATAPAGETTPGPIALGTATATAPLQHKTALSGSHLDVSMMRNGQVIHTANAEVNLPNLLMTVFTTTRRDSGEVPFAIGKDGHIYTPTDDDLKKVQAIGGDPLKPDTPPGVAMVHDWIVVTTADPTGSGLKLGIARPVGDSLANLRRTTVRNAGFGLMFIAFAIAGIVPVATRLTRNLSRLSDGVHRIAQGDYRARVEVRSHDEIGRLAVAFNDMAEDVERHQRAVVEQERTKRELELGRQIQHDMLPQSPLRFGPIEIEGVSVPAREVGGDFFNYFELPSGQVALLVGDVSGKGVGAALLMANIQASLRTRLALGQDLAALAQEIDRDIEASTPGSVYATLFVGVLDPATRELRYVNAGHYPQYVVRRSGLERMPATGLPVGLLAGRGYSERRVQLEAGDILFFYTDGCVDNESETGEMFNMERLEDVLAECAAEGARDVLARVEKTVSDFRGSREPFDDATTMVVKVG